MIRRIKNMFNENCTCNSTCCGYPSVCLADENNEFGMFKLKEFEFAGGFNLYDDEYGMWQHIYIEKVMYSNPATIVMWSDGTKTVTKVHGEDVYSPEVGLVMCVLKKLYGSTKVHDLLHQWISEKAYSERACVTVKDVRKAEKTKKNNDK